MSAPPQDMAAGDAGVAHVYPMLLPGGCQAIGKPQGQHSGGEARDSQAGSGVPKPAGTASQTLHTQALLDAMEELRIQWGLKGWI